MGQEKDIFVALEFGSSAIRGIAGHKRADGNIKVLDIETERTAESVQRGVVYNIDTTTAAIANIANRIGERLRMKVRKAYVGISGQSLHTSLATISRTLETTVKVTDELMDQLSDNNLDTDYHDSEILHVVPQEYIVGHHTVSNPVGIMADKVEARYLNVMAKRMLADNIRQCMGKAGIEEANDIIVSPIALADAILTESEKRSGCALIDFGAATTTVSVFLSGILRHMRVIPMGGDNITRDLMHSKQISWEEAESLKRKHGVAYVAVDTANPQSFSIAGNRSIDENELLNIVGARQEEIILNAWEQVKEMSDKLLAGIVITGGAAQMKDMTEAIKHFTHFQQVRVAKSLITSVEVAPHVTPPTDMNIDTLIALARMAEECCVQVKSDGPQEGATQEDTPEQGDDEEPPQGRKPPRGGQGGNGINRIRKAGRWFKTMLEEQTEEDE